MPRRARLRLPGLPLHIIQRGNNRTACFYADDRELFRSELDPAQLDEIRSAVNGGFALGNDRFKAQIAQMLKRRVERGAPGRPRKKKPQLSEAGIQPG